MELADLKTKQSPQNEPQRPPCTEIGPRARILDACGQLNVDGGHALDRGKPKYNKQIFKPQRHRRDVAPGPAPAQRRGE